MGLNDLEYLSKKDIKEIHKIERLLRNSPYFKSYIDSLNKSLKELENQNNELKKANEQLKQDNLTFKRDVENGIIDFKKSVEEKVEEIKSKVKLQEDTDTQILTEYLYGSQERSAES